MVAVVAFGLEVIGAAVVLEVAVQAAWHLGARRFWRPDPPKCDRIMRFKQSDDLRCEYDADHDGPHRFTSAGYTYYRENEWKEKSD